MRVTPAHAATDFSLVLGGPLFQLFRRAHLSGDALELSRRRVLVIAGLAWLPLLLLSTFAGHAASDAVAIPFLFDIEAHVRFLIALPILIAAELLVHLRINTTVRQFSERQIVDARSDAGFQRAIASTLRIRNSVSAELVLLVLVYTVGLWFWSTRIALSAPSWYASPQDGDLNLTPAGYWYAFVSLPIFQFILLRWYLRFFLWFWLLWRVAKLDLQLTPLHPDRTGGLGFLTVSAEAFSPILVAQGALLAGLIASQIFHANGELMAFKVEIAGFLAFFILVVLLPLTVFIPHLARAKRIGRAQFGVLATRYAREFEDKWIRQGAADRETLLGSGDIQSLADLGNSLSHVQDMRLVPFGPKEIARFTLVAATPFLPLLLTTFSLEELVDRLVTVLF